MKLSSMREGNLGFQFGCLDMKEFGSPSTNPMNTSPTMRPPICPSRGLVEKPLQSVSSSPRRTDPWQE